VIIHLMQKAAPGAAPTIGLLAVDDTHSGAGDMVGVDLTAGQAATLAGMLTGAITATVD
jgi:hypothetical protein